MVTQTCRRTETLLNLGQMNGSSTSQLPASPRKKKDLLIGLQQIIGFLWKCLDSLRNALIFGEQKILIGFQQIIDI